MGYPGAKRVVYHSDKAEMGSSPSLGRVGGAVALGRKLSGGGDIGLPCGQHAPSLTSCLQPGTVEQRHQSPHLVTSLWLHPEHPQGAGEAGGEVRLWAREATAEQAARFHCCIGHWWAEQCYQALSFPEQPLLAFASEGRPPAPSPPWTSGVLASSLSSSSLGKHRVQPEIGDQTSKRVSGWLCSTLLGCSEISTNGF